MKIVTDLIHSQIGEETEILRAVRIKDPDSGDEKLVEPHELVDPDGVEVGDEDAYKVSLFEADPEDSILAATYNILQR